MERAQGAVPVEAGITSMCIDGQSLVVLASLVSRIDKRAFWKMVMLLALETQQTSRAFHFNGL